MASLAIAIGSAVSALLPLIPKIVTACEAAFGSGTGPTKLATAVEMVNTVAKQLAAAGKIEGIPDATAITTMVETVVQQLKAEGELTKSAGTAQVYRGATIVVLGGQRS